MKGISTPLMNPDALEKLIGLRDRINNLKAVKCMMSHERVRIDKGTGLPITRRMSEPVFVRKGLCSPEVRRNRISCGHTMARYDLEDALELLASEGVATTPHREELSELADMIHALDHEKGFAEVHLAHLFEKRIRQPESFSETELETVIAKIRSIETQHDDCVEKIASLQEWILVEFNSLSTGLHNPKSQIQNPKSKYADLET